MKNRYTQEYTGIKREIIISPSATELAEFLSKCDSSYQAIFISALAEIAEKWEGDKDGRQMLFIKEDLGPKGKAFVKKFCEYVLIHEGK